MTPLMYEFDVLKNMCGCFQVFASMCGCFQVFCIHGTFLLDFCLVDVVVDLGDTLIMGYPYICDICQHPAPVLLLPGRVALCPKHYREVKLV